MSNKRNDTSKGIIKTFYVSRYRKSFIEAVEKFAKERAVPFSDLVIEALFFYFYSRYNLSVQERQLFQNICEATAEAQSYRGLLDEVYKSSVGGSSVKTRD